MSGDIREITLHKLHSGDRQPGVFASGNVGIAGAEQSYGIAYAYEGGEGTTLPIEFISIEREGVTNEALLAIVIDRLEGFQRGAFPCKENEVALNHAKSALSVLHARTLGRMSRGVEGKELT